MTWAHSETRSMCNDNNCSRQDHYVIGGPNDPDVRPAQRMYPYHKDGSICPDWDSCDTYEHYSTANLTELGVAAQPIDENPPFLTREEAKQVVRDGNVGELIDGRIDVYGDPVTCFVRHAQVWSGILGIEVQPWQVALCMAGYKLVRTGITPDYSDNSDDIDGYMDIFRQLMPDMVQARDTASYLAGGGQGARS